MQKRSCDCRSRELKPNVPGRQTVPDSDRSQIHGIFFVVACSRASVCFVVALSMIGLAPARVLAAPDAAATAPEPAPATDLTEAQRLYEDGRAAYDTFNYDVAINLWTTALARLPQTPEAGGVRNALVYNLASAQLKAYALDKDVIRLKRARLLLESYLEQEHQAGAADPADVERVEAQMAEIDAELAKTEAPPPEPARTDIIPPPPASKPHEPSKRGTVMIGVGATLLVVAAGLTGGMATGIVIGRRAEKRLGELDTLADEMERPDVVARGKLGNRTAITTGVVAGLALAGGIALVVVGQRTRTRDKLEARTIMRVGPMIAPGMFGLGAQVRL